MLSRQKTAFFRMILAAAMLVPITPEALP